jgi:hypothetical protein
MDAAAASRHHVQDVGKILLQAQSDLRTIRETLNAAGVSNGGGQPSSGAASASLQQVVEKVEAELRLKAEAVLNTVVQGSVNTLPTLGQYNFNNTQPLNTTAPPPTYSTLLRRKPPPGPMPRVTRSAGDSRQGQDPIARPAAAAVAAARHVSAVRNPTNANSRQVMADRYGIDAPATHEPLRPIGRVPKGKLKTERVSRALGVPPAAVRNDPQAVPPIGPKDVAAGLYSLVTRGLIPPSVDLTPAMERRPAPLAQGPARVHDFKTQFAAHNSSAYISPFGFNVSNTRLDLLTDVGVTLAEKKKQVAAEEAATAAFVPSAEEAPVEPTGAGGQQTDQAARQFDELMDSYSLHHFIIRHGTTLNSTPEFASFQRKYASDWGAVEQLVCALEELMRAYSVPLAYVDGQKLAALACDPLAVRDAPALVECLVNAEQVRACMEVPGQRYRVGSDAESLAATELQSATRGMLGRRSAAQMRANGDAAAVVTGRAKVFLLSRWRARAAQVAIAAERERWDELCARFKVNWPRVREAPRVVIHIGSLSCTGDQRLSMRDLELRQNAQLPRLCDVRHPNVDVLYVAPFALNEDVTQYFSKVLEIGGVGEPAKRFKIVVPENLSRFPHTLSLTSMLLYSPRALKRITNFCRGKHAYIVPGIVGPEERKLALALNIPLLAPAPQTAATFGSKSGAKRVFAAAQVNTPPGIHDLYDDNAVCQALSTLICAHLDVPRWIFKLDDEFGGRGHAHLDVASLKVHAELLRTHDASPHTWDDPNVQREVQENLTMELRTLLPEQAVINCRWLWKSWREYAGALARVGGVIEASPLQISSSPSVNVLIEPDGHCSIKSAHEQIFSSPYTFVGAAFPQTAVPFAALREASLAVGKACYDQGILGHVGVDFVSFLDEQGRLRLWAVDLNLRLTHTAVTFNFFDFLVGGRFDTATGRYALDGVGSSGGAAAGLQQRSYVMNEVMYHPQLSSIHHSAFFNLCRLKGVSFDLQERTGTVFNLMDSFVGGVLGIITVGTSLLDALRKFADCLDFMQKQVGPATGGKPTALTHEVSFRDMIKAIKAIVDANVGDAKPPQIPQPPQPPPLPKEVPREVDGDAELALPGVAGMAIRPHVEPPHKRYLQTGDGAPAGAPGPAPPNS